MNSRPSMRRSVGPALIKKHDRRRDRIPDRTSKALMGVEADFIRTAGPQAITEHFAQLEAKREVVAIIDTTPEEDEQSAEIEEPDDIEPYTEDEDVEPVEIWGAFDNHSMNAVALGKTAASSWTHPENDNFELVIGDGTCKFTDLEWAWKYKPTSQRAEKQLGELAARCRVFRELAEWLNLNRAGFLKSQDFWQLGPVSLEEVERGCSVVQREMVSFLKIDSLNEENFSRYIQHCIVTWPEGSASVQILFSKQARLAWVAKAVVLFARESRKVSLHDRMNKVRDTTIRRSDRSQTIKFSRAMTFEQFVPFVNAKADTSWQEVLTHYEQRMLDEYDHEQKS